MTISTTTARVEYTGNGATTGFSVPFYFLANADLKVYQAGTLKTITTHYTVSGAGNPAGGTVTFVTAPASAEAVVILRDPAITQETDYTPNDPFPAESHEQALDKLTMIAQRLQDQVERSFTLPDSDTSGASTELPTPEALAIIGWNAGGDGLTNYDAAALAGSAATVDWLTDVFDGDASTVAFTLTRDPGSASNCDVAISGVTQVPGVDYTVSSTTITFASAPPSGSGNVMVRYGSALPVGSLPSGAAASGPITTSGLTMTTGTVAVRTTAGTGAIEEKALTDFVLADGSVVMTGDLQMAAGKGVIFEGTTADAYETTLSAGEPTGDRTVTMPDLSGTIALLESIQARTGVAYTTGGTSTAYTLTPSPALTALAENQEFDVEFHTAAGATPTLAISGLTAKSLKYRDSSGTLTAVTSTQVPSGWRSKVTYDGTDYIVREVPPASSSGGITNGTYTAMSGTSVDFSGIPTTTKRIVVKFNSVSTNGTSYPIVQIGPSGGVETSGYTSTWSGNNNGGAASSRTATAGMIFAPASAASDTNFGMMILELVDSATNLWQAIMLEAGTFNSTTSVGYSSSYKALAGAINKLRLTMVNGTDTFDAGNVNISYE